MQPEPHTSRESREPAPAMPVERLDEPAPRAPSSTRADGSRAAGGISRRVWIVMANIVALVATLLLMWEVRTILSWVLVALLLALALHPAMSWLRRHRIKRGWAVLMLLVGILAVVGTLGATLVPMLVEQGRDLVQRLPDLVDRLQQWPPVRWVNRQFDVLSAIRGYAQEGAGGLAAPALAAAKSVAQGVTASITILVLTVFMLLFGGEVVDSSLQWLPPGRRDHFRRLGCRMRKVVGGYVAGTFLVACVGGLVMGTTLAVLGVPYFLPLGLVMVVLGIIPFLGSILGAVLLVGLTFASVGVKAGVICGAVYLGYQQVENEVLQPLVQRRTLSMNPLLITLAVLIGTALAGILGTLLALPVAGAIQVVLQDALAQRTARWSAQSS